MPKPCFLILNPTSGRYSEPEVDRIVQALSAHGYTPELFITRTAKDGQNIARQLCERQQNPLIIVGGGDGTINGVANGLIPGRATLGILPLGTANVLAKEVGIRNVADAVERIIRGATRQLAAGLVKAGERERRFLLMVGIGFDARVVQETRSAEKKKLKQGAYLLAGMRCLWSWERELLQVTTDSGETVLCHSLVVCNAARYGGTFRLAPEADISTPGFQVVCVTRPTRATVAALATATVLGMPSLAGGVRRFAAGSLTVSGFKPVQIDGDAWGESPATIEAISGFARLIV